MPMDRSKTRGANNSHSAAEEKQQILRRSPLGTLSGDGQEALLDLATLERLPRRHSLLKQGEPARSVALIGAGRVGLERVREGRTFSLGHRGPGETVGETSMVGSSIASEDATVLDETEALLLPIAGLRKLILADPSVRAAMAAVLVERHRVAEERLESLLLHGVESRLIDFLIAARARWGVAHPGGQLIRAPFTHADVAHLIGSTRETVTLLFGKLKREGMIDFEKRRIIIRDRAALEQRVAAA
jgi:CRP/FNR family transcriptional regulator, cyclic AMP receptor protein